MTPRTILARTNASTITAVIDALDSAHRPYLVGGTGELMEMLRGVQGLKQSQPSTVPEFFGFANWNEVIEFAKSGEGAHLLTFVNLVESRGERQLMWALNRTVDEDKSDLTVSTAHKAKGREWPTVRLMDDFLKSQVRPKPDGSQGESGYDPSELRLFYVALTRAREAIEVPSNLLGLIGLKPAPGATGDNRSAEPRRSPSAAPPASSDRRDPLKNAWTPPTDWKSPAAPPQSNGERPLIPARNTANQKSGTQSRKGGFWNWLTGY